MFSDCPSKAFLVGGGISASGVFADRTYATGTGPVVLGGGTFPTSWGAEINNLTGGASANQLTAYAVCRKR